MSSFRARRYHGFVLLAAALGFFLLVWPTRRLESENFVFYLPNEHRLIPLENIGGDEYLPLLPVLNLRGPVQGIEEKKNSLKVWVAGDQLQFQLNRQKVEINKAAISLRKPIRRVNGEWMAPVGFLSGVFARLPGAAIHYQAGSTRAFLGGVHPVAYSVRLENIPDGARLVIQFTGKVSAETASRNGKWIVFLNGAPIEPMEPSIRFVSPYLRELQFDDQDGHPKLIITPNIASLNFYPVMMQGQQVLVADFQLPQAPAASPAPGKQPGIKPSLPAPPPISTLGQAGGQKGSVAAKAAGAPEAAPSPPPPPLPVIALDAGHGGADGGARSRDGVLEKNLAASLVAQVSEALEQSRKVRVILSRPGDTDPTIEERTITANTSRPAAFVTFHAGDTGGQTPSIRVYTYRPSSPRIAPLSGTGAVHQPSLFVPWDMAQQPDQARSQILAQDLARDFAAIAGASAPSPEAVPVRMLRSIAAPAAAIELGSISPDSNSGILIQPAFQKQVADAAVAALLEFVQGASKP
ncbi:MAG: N-acetylmuramoyl-L-alanine amidase [Acidobacteriota bacterium]|nr:N-acetylmuramoyl-L-alanine amidase [Acidobacteriota bacterium]